LQPPDAYFSSSDAQTSNHCRAKRLKPEQQITPLGLQYDRTKMLCRSAARQMSGFDPELAGVDPRGDELEMNL
jgi:hypothetical protein